MMTMCICAWMTPRLRANTPPTHRARRTPPRTATPPRDASRRTVTTTDDRRPTTDDRRPTRRVDRIRNRSTPRIDRVRGAPPTDAPTRPNHHRGPRPSTHTPRRSNSRSIDATHRSRAHEFAIAGIAMRVSFLFLRRARGTARRARDRVRRVCGARTRTHTHTHRH